MAIALNDLFESLAQLLMKKGLLQTGIEFQDWHTIASFISGNITSPVLWLGIIIYTLNFFIWIAILSRVDLSIAMPIGSTTYIVIPILAVIFLKETVPPLRWLGILLIVLGIYFVSKSSNSSSCRVPEAS